MNKYSLPFKISLLATAIALTACGGDDKKSSSPAGLQNKAEGQFVISAIGGNSTLGRAGDGGSLGVVKISSARTLNISKYGTVDTRYKLAPLTPEFGSNKLQVTVDTNILVGLSSDSTELQSGVLYVEGRGVYKFEEGKFEDKTTRITGIEVANGATLSFVKTSPGIAPLMSISEDDLDSARINLKNDLVNNGTITTLHTIGTDKDRLDLSLSVSRYIADGSIEQSGLETGDDGGDVEITGFIIKNNGDITTSGAAGDDMPASGVLAGDEVGAGVAGEVELNAAEYVENTAAITSLGANGIKQNKSRSGCGADVDIFARSIYNSGEIKASSGDGEFVSSHSNCNTDVNLAAMGQLINSGNIEINGGTAADPDDRSNYGGLAGGYVNLVLQNSQLRDRKLINSGDISVKGGSSDIDGGKGGGIFISASEDIGLLSGGYGYGGNLPSYLNGYSLTQNDGSSSIVAVSGNLTADGGTSHSTTSHDEGYDYEAGKGGSITIIHVANEFSNYETNVVGYQMLDASSGSGKVFADSGSVRLTTAESQVGYILKEEGIGPFASGPDEEIFAEGLNPQPTPSLDIKTNLTAAVGSQIGNTSTVMSDGYSGAGYVSLTVVSENADLLPTKPSITMEGNISIAGADSKNTKPVSSGRISIYAPYNIKLVGDIDAQAGSHVMELAGDDLVDYEGSFSDGSWGGSLIALSEFGNLTYKGDINLNGGDVGGSARNAGGGGYAEFLSGGGLSVAGSITTTGGDAPETNPTDVNDKTEGGDGGLVIAVNTQKNAKLTDQLTLSAGTGDIAGDQGSGLKNDECINSCVARYAGGDLH